MTAINCLSRLYHYFGNWWNRKKAERVILTPYVVRSELNLRLDEINAVVFETVLGLSNQFSEYYPFYRFSASFDRIIDANTGRLIVEFTIAPTLIEEPSVGEKRTEE